MIDSVAIVVTSLFALMVAVRATLLDQRRSDPAERRSSVELQDES
jgi:hypothetical protein